MADAASDAAFLGRNAVDCLPEGALAERLAAGRSLRVKLGIDPTSPDIHLGHTVVLQKLREFQERGHTVVLIIGDYTARVGDPSGRSATRPLLSGDEIEANARTYVEQASKVLLGGERLELRHNGEWLDMAMEELFGLVRTVTVARLLERDDFAKRYGSGQPISLLELLYPVMQGYDSVAVRADVELGGTDQKFNLLMGRDIQTAYGQTEQVVLTMPILAGLDGERKMSKSYANHVGIADPPADMYGKTMRVPDAAMPSWYELLLGEPSPAGLSARDAKHALARALVERFHGAEAAAGAAGHFERLFVARDLPEDVADVEFVPADGAVHLPALLGKAFGISRSEARRMVQSGGVRVDGEPLADLDVPGERIDGRVLQLGRRRYCRVRLRG